MNNKYLYLIPLSLIEVVLQLIFFWLAPKSDCYWVVYTFGTVTSIMHIVMVFIASYVLGIRKSAAIVIAGSTIAIGTIVTCGLLLVNKGTVRNATFSLLICLITYAVVTMLLIMSIENMEVNNVPIQPDGEDLLLVRTGMEPLPQTDDLFSEEMNNNRALAPVRNTDVTPPPLPVKNA